MAVPVHIVSGFLGAGKTTAIRAQLEARPDERVAIIVNDFGEAAFDEAVLAEGEPYRITNIPGGCVCCTAPEGFAQALGAVLAEQPDRLWIEPTGLARPQDLIDTIQRGPHRDAVRVAPLVVLVDPRQLGRDGDAGERELLVAQLEAADVLVANRTDLCSAEDLARFDALVAGLWPAPLSVHRTRHGRLPGALLEWPEREGARRPRAAGRTDAPAHAHLHPNRDPHSTRGHVARSWVWSREQVFDRGRLRAALEAEGDALVRFKGIFRTQEGVLRLERAGGEVHEAQSAYRRDSRADAIVRAADAAALDALARSLVAAELDAAELRARGQRIELVEPSGRIHALDRALLAALPGGVDDVATLFPKRRGAAARVDRLLQHLEIAGGSRAVVCAADGFASEPVDVAALGQGLLLHSLDGGPLPEDQGGPFRLLIPDGVTGAPSACANVKAVTRIVLRA